MGLEGIVSKQQDAPYRSGRVESWIKVKCGKRDAFPIVAFVEKLGAKPRRIASFYVGRREGNRLLYAGTVRGGFTEPEARDLRERLDPFIRKDSPLSEPVKKPKATWGAGDRGRDRLQHTHGKQAAARSRVQGRARGPGVAGGASVSRDAGALRRPPG